MPKDIGHQLGFSVMRQLERAYQVKVNKRCLLLAELRVSGAPSSFLLTITVFVIILTAQVRSKYPSVVRHELFTTSVIISYPKILLIKTTKPQWSAHFGPRLQNRKYNAQAVS